MARFRKVPTVEAVQYQPGMVMPKWIEDLFSWGFMTHDRAKNELILFSKTGKTYIKAGYWLIHEDDGSVYALADVKFRDRYAEEVTMASATAGTP